jgi:hypothetical protein
MPKGRGFGSRMLSHSRLSYTSDKTDATTPLREFPSGGQKLIWSFETMTVLIHCGNQ